MDLPYCIVSVPTRPPAVLELLLPSPVHQGETVPITLRLRMPETGRSPFSSPADRLHLMFQLPGPTARWSGAGWIEG